MSRKITKIIGWFELKLWEEVHNVNRRQLWLNRFITLAIYAILGITVERVSWENCSDLCALFEDFKVHEAHYIKRTFKSIVYFFQKMNPNFQLTKNFQPTVWVSWFLWISSLMPYCQGWFRDHEVNPECNEQSVYAASKSSSESLSCFLSLVLGPCWVSL